jgi:2-methylisocitrate lyase-like PEP mutase family enzyme
MLKEMRRQKGEQQRRYRAKKNKTKNKERKPVHSIKEMIEKIKVIKKENEKRKAVIRTQRWRLRIKL